MTKSRMKNNISIKVTNDFYVFIMNFSFEVNLPNYSK